MFYPGKVCRGEKLMGPKTTVIGLDAKNPAGRLQPPSHEAAAMGFLCV